MSTLDQMIHSYMVEPKIKSCTLMCVIQWLIDTLWCGAPYILDKTSKPNVITRITWSDKSWVMVKRLFEMIKANEAQWDSTGYLINWIRIYSDWSRLIFYNSPQLKLTTMVFHKKIPQPVNHPSQKNEVWNTYSGLTVTA